MQQITFKQLFNLHYKISIVEVNRTTCAYNVKHILKCFQLNINLWCCWKKWFKTVVLSLL